ncbi:hypothetical protein [Thermophilibacter immobilis]|uniref:Uncharacterized protein n=1 Tax=Thermophilibacter immobilis TaxID=2779519 RepID=A0A7S7RU92_9ACTN|nr:hypothetical protein [Thermophilibacter immobilis]QOY60363.1 hypothetical protein INP52_08115 [Thermophilibacter immobilis]
MTFVPVAGGLPAMATFGFGFATGEGKVCPVEFLQVKEVNFDVITEGDASPNPNSISSLGSGTGDSASSLVTIVEKRQIRIGEFKRVLV